MIAVLLLNQMCTKRRNSREPLEPPPDLDMFCRTCLGKENLVSIFSNRESERKRTAELRQVTGQAIKMNDGLPQKICSACVDTISIALQFRYKCAETHKKLSRLVTKTEKPVKTRRKKKITEVNLLEENISNDNDFLSSDSHSDWELDNVKDKPKPASDDSKAVSDDDLKAISDDEFNAVSDDDSKAVSDEDSKAEDPLPESWNIVPGKRPPRPPRRPLMLKRALDKMKGVKSKQLFEDAKVKRTKSDRKTEPQDPAIKEKTFWDQTCWSKTEDGTYQCHLCDKQYKNKNSWQAHVGFHRHYCVCEDCGKRCNNNYALIAHKRAKHGMPRIHICAFCEYTSATKEALVIHERRHTGERPFICDHCGASFTRRGNLVQHSAIHLPESNFECEICHKREKSKFLLKNHIYKVHEKKYRYLCPVCNHVFNSCFSVRMHLVKRHGVPKDQQGEISKFRVNQPPPTAVMQNAKKQAPNLLPAQPTEKTTSLPLETTANDMQTSVNSDDGSRPFIIAELAESK